MNYTSFFSFPFLCSPLFSVLLSSSPFHFILFLLYILSSPLLSFPILSPTFFPLLSSSLDKKLLVSISSYSLWWIYLLLFFLLCLSLSTSSSDPVLPLFIAHLRFLLPALSSTSSHALPLLPPRIPPPVNPFSTLFALILPLPLPSLLVLLFLSVILPLEHIQSEWKMRENSHSCMIVQDRTAQICSMNAFRT